MAQLRFAYLCALPALAVAACATVPHDPTARALYGDLAKAVELSDTTGWVIDRVQLENNVEHALHSVCQVAPEKRRALERWLDAQLALAGGSAAELYRQNGRDLGAVSDVLEMERIRALLLYADERAAADCPFGLEPDLTFLGVESDHGRLVLLAETIGYGSLVVEGDDSALGGGGGGRVLAGYGLGPQLTLALDAEVGGSGAFADNEMGSRSIETTFTAATPLLMRLSNQSRVYDFEVAPSVRSTPAQTSSRRACAARWAWAFRRCARHRSCRMRCSGWATSSIPKATSAQPITACTSARASASTGIRDGMLKVVALGASVGIVV